MVLVSEQPQKYSNIEYGKSIQPTFVTILSATIIKDLTKWKRYKANMISGFFSVTIMALVFGLFASVSTFRNLELTGKEQFLFFFVGVLLTIFSDIALWAPVNTVTSDLYNGTMEYIYSTGSSKYAYFLGTTIANVIIRMLYFIPMSIFLFFYTNIGTEFIMYAIFVMLMSLATMISMGVVFASLAILWKQIGSILQLYTTVAQFFAGIYIPLIALPRGFHYFSLIFPHTYLFDLTRYYVMEGQWPTLFPVWVEWTFLLIYLVIIFVSTKFLLAKVDEHAKSKGLHLI